MTAPRPTPPARPTPTTTLLAAADRADGTTPMGPSEAVRLATLLKGRDQVHITHTTAAVAALARAYRLGYLAITTGNVLSLTELGRTALARTPTGQRATRLTTTSAAHHGILLIGDPWLTATETGTRYHRAYERSPLIDYRAPSTAVASAHYWHGPHRGVAALTDTGLWALLTYTNPDEEPATTGLRSIALARYLAHTPTTISTTTTNVAALSRRADNPHRPTRPDTVPTPARPLGDTLDTTHLYATEHWPATADHPTDPLVALAQDLAAEGVAALTHGTPLTRTETVGPRTLIDYGNFTADLAAHIHALI